MLLLIILDVNILLCVYFCLSTTGALIKGIKPTLFMYLVDSLSSFTELRSGLCVSQKNTRYLFSLPQSKQPKCSSGTTEESWIIPQNSPTCLGLSVTLLHYHYIFTVLSVKSFVAMDPFNCKNENSTHIPQ